MDLGVAAFDLVALVPPVEAELDRAAAKGGHQRPVAGQDAQPAVEAGPNPVA